MTTQEVRETLGNEGELLDHIIACAKDFDGSKFTKQGKFIHDSWVRFLGERRSANVALQESDDAALEKDLEAELVQVKKYVKETDDSPSFAEQWGKFLRCERDILEYLINLCSRASTL